MNALCRHGAAPSLATDAERGYLQTMTTSAAMARVAALMGDPARANMLASLMDGRAHTPTELALDAGVTASTASGHLAQLLDGGLVDVASQGRRRYYKLASAEVARILEGLMAVSAKADPRPRAAPRVPAELMEARACYDHLAGRLGVGIADALIERQHVSLHGEVAAITDSGVAALSEMGIDLERARGKSKRLLCGPCLDWSERRPHIAGVLGAAIFQHLLERDWIRRVPGGRAIAVTAAGRRELKRSFGFAAA